MRIFVIAFAVFSAVCGARKVAEVAKLGSRNDIKKGSRVSPDTVHEVIFSVKLNNINELEEIVREISDPRSGKYGKHLTRKQVADLTANPSASVSIEKFLLERGINISKRSKYGEYITARARVSAWEELFETTFHDFQRLSPMEGSIDHFIRCEQYSLPVEIEEHISAVFNTVQIPAPAQYFHSSSKKATAASGAPPLIDEGATTPLLISEFCET